ncbi:MAG TPA: tRNA lysidine(34) synthetase TilS [Nocardioides sp.]|uniref:tRNA lysidine(34) synthetase TilS n=1 Tax=Nocardioides sp. TaxID=35761 RepID=UPI002D806403|nr:tRNA lysidine(34) synthetase TilS [Nocardioides sp.]HET6651771.1 tRNA lysidine(34) synthetase TilS [Nocardioides sp.]
MAAVRRAVRRCLDQVPDPEGGVGLVACSGGADSLALLAAAVFEARRLALRVIGVTVDHGLQPGSATHADRVVAQMAGLGADETVAVRVCVEPAGLGVEAAAREARYAVLEEVAQRTSASVVLLGHTRDDQAETVLLGLTRGSGGRAIAGMRAAYDVFRRPLLDVARSQTEQACRAEGIAYWEDPHNQDPRFTRSRVRHTVMPMLEAELGPGVAETLARTAEQLQEDVAALDAIAAAAHDEVAGPDGLRVDGLLALHTAVRRRVIRLAAVAAGASPGELFRVHVVAVDELVTAYRGQRWVDLPGHLRATREGPLLRFRPTDEAGAGAVGG